MVSATMENRNKSCFSLGALAISTVVLILCSTVSLGQPADLPELKLVVSLFRHGGRVPGNNPWETFPTDPHKHATYKEGRGQLTNDGKLDSYKFGVALRQKYGSFLGNSYYFQEVDARSTGIVRSLASLQLVLAGMYPPSEEQKWNNELNWQPAYTTTVPFEEDVLLLPGIASDLYKDASAEALASPEAQLKLAKFQEFFDYLEKKTGQIQNTPTHLQLLYQTFSSQTAAKLPLPDWAKDIFPKGKLRDGVLLQYELQNLNDKQKRLNGGVLLHKIIKDMNVAINGTAPESQKKVFLYSAQDGTLVALMKVLEIYDNEPPAFCSAVNLELRASSDGKHYVKIGRYPGNTTELKEVKIPGCADLCPFEDFLKLTSKYIPSKEELSNVHTRTESYI